MCVCVWLWPILVGRHEQVFDTHERTFHDGGGESTDGGGESTDSVQYSVVHFSYTGNSVQCKPNEHIVPYSANRGSGIVFFTASGFFGKSGTLLQTTGGAVRSV